MNDFIPKSIENGQEFLDLFYSPTIDSYPLSIKTKISLYVLRIESGGFDYESMYKQLGNASVSYVFSRVKLEGMSNKNAHEYVKKAQDSFRKPELSSGEGGELFLYCFLETHLGAPKVLSKMELKTAANDYVKGSDGIHLLDCGKGEYHLIFGESKMIGDSTEKGSSFRKAISEAFTSMKKVADGGFSDDLALVDSHLMKESVSPELLEYLKKILKPSAKDGVINKHNAFGIFIGYEVDIEDWDLPNITNEEFQEKIVTEARGLVEAKYQHIQSKIKETELEGYHFYIYAIPFIKKGTKNLEKIRETIIKKVKNDIS